MTGSPAVDGPAGRLHALGVEQRDVMAWRLPLTAIGPAVIAAVTLAASETERPILLAGLLVAAAAPWVIEAARGCEFRAPLVFVTAGAIAVIHLLGDRIGIVDPADRADDVQVALLILAFAVGETAATRSRRLARAMFAVGVAVSVAAAFVGVRYDSAAIWTGAMFIALFCGLLIRRLLLTLADLKEAHAALESSAATRERQRIAREVHDVIAHSLTITMLQITAARMAVGRGDPAAATEALEDAERLGRQSLADIRSTVGLLRADDFAAATAASLPGAGDLGELVDGYRSAGLDVTAVIDPGVADLPKPTALAVFRIVQEALANVAKHARGARANVVVAIADAIDVTVADTGGPRAAMASTASGTGHGVTGMRERAESLGGSLHAGPSPTGWRVRATIPNP